MLTMGQVRRLAKAVEGAAEDLPAWLSEFLLEEGLRALKLTTLATPVDTGQLRRSWQISRVERAGSVLRVELVNPTEYAAEVEYGHVIANQYGTYGFKPGVHMAEISVKKVEAAMPPRLKRGFEAFLRKHGWGSAG